MKIKLGNVVLNYRALVKLFLIFFLFGALIGVKILIRDGHNDVSLLPFMPIFVILIVRLYRGVQKEIDSERL
ncbi:hypothetical protein [Spirosoma rhododendri]|uniref:Uncharacterized protein n=1 Tax=Spirosoma rhododendri TaxID=2728024 RepID=A0A7L5DK12_9BACT|nr:hypothetical protein [Spirosoma rhododendri]QJD77493.1 hypothetical protein HH216_02980 [Spirosoma rhododendri]